MRLGELQQRFSESLRGDQQRHDLPITGQGMRVYRNNYREQLRSALRTAFPYLALWLGDLEFERVCDAHIARHFPHSWTLDHYGHDFGATVLALFPQDPELYELAWLDWAMSEALVAEDEPTLVTSGLAELDWDGARIIFASSVRLLETKSNAADIWVALEDQSPPPSAALLPESQALLVWRCGLIPCFRSIPDWEFELISALRRGLSFAAACEILRLRFDVQGAVKAAGEMLARWLGDDMITRVEAEVLSEV